MAEDSSSSATDAAAALESYYDFSIVQVSFLRLMELWKRF